MVEGVEVFPLRKVEDERTTWLEKNDGGWKWKEAVKLKYKVQGREFQVTIPRSALNSSEDTTSLALDFKWADNCIRARDWTDFTLHGDTAPNDRFCFRARLR